MRVLLLLSALVALACAGGGSLPGGEPVAAERSGSAAPAETPAPAAARAPASQATAGSGPAEAALADHWLVILASKLDPAEPVPSLDTLRAHPDLAGPVQRISSSRFKNLMPCYTVTIADATKDKQAALALSKQLKGLGVDNYVKSAGAYIGPSAAIDAYCSARGAPPVEDVRFATRVDGALWLPLGTPEAELAALVAAAPPPEPKGDAYDAWSSPLSERPGVGARYRLVDAESGRMQVCGQAESALLTLGTPHFGALQADGGPKAPTCGSPAEFARLSCPESVATGTWIAAPEGQALAGYESLGAAPGLEAAARAWLRANTSFDEAPAVDEAFADDVRRELTVTRWRGVRGEVALVAATREAGPGVCGGDATTWWAVFPLTADKLGEPVTTGEAAFVRVLGLVDLGADGTPELVTVGFPDTWSVVGAEGGTETSFGIDFCDCAC
jgi:hypothetical protein